MAPSVNSLSVRSYLLWALLLGAVGGLIFDLRIWVNTYFFGDSPDLTIGLILENIFKTLFAACILMTRGIAERSRVPALAGALAGVIIGIVTLPISLMMAPPWPIFPIVRMGLMGLAAGLIWGGGNPSSSRRLHAVLAGFGGGVLGIPIFYLVVVLSALSHTGVQMLDGSLLSEFTFGVVHYVGIVVIGATQSLTIWYLILRFDSVPIVNREPAES